MKIIEVQPSFIWPEPRTLEAHGVYEYVPPLRQLAQESHSLFGVVTSITIKGLEVLMDWLNDNPHLKIYLIVGVYPTCATRREDLLKLLDLMGHMSERLFARLYALEFVTERMANALCFLALKPDSDAVHLATGSSENLGQSQSGDNQPGQMNFVFQADPVLVENFKRYFDWLWVKSAEISKIGVARIPHLILPEGTEEGALLWRKFVDECNGLTETSEADQMVAHVDPVTGDVKLVDGKGIEITPPTEELGLPKLDPLAEKIAQLYKKGALISIDKLSRIPPVDAPLSPDLFGDAAELQMGNVSRKVSMRVSVIDDKTLKEIEKRRNGLRLLLNKFAFGLADGMRWMPASAKMLFESEVKRISDEGQKLISDLLKGDHDAFLKSRRPQLVMDINAMYGQLGRTGQVSEEVITKVVEDLKARLGKLQTASLMPKLSYSTISFSRAENEFSSPWGQAYSLLADIAAFPRKALTDSFFLRGLKISEDDLIEAMNVADDALCRDLRTRSIKERCKVELDLLTRIEKTPLEAKNRCELVWQILAGDSVEAINEALKKKEIK